MLSADEEFSPDPDVNPSADGTEFFTGTISGDGSLTISWRNTFGDTGEVTMMPTSAPE